MIILRRTPTVFESYSTVPRLAQGDPLVSMIEPWRRRLRLGVDGTGKATQDDRGLQGSDDARAVHDEDS